MTSAFLVLMIVGQDATPIQTMKGLVVAVGESSITVSNEKERRKFRTNTGASIVVDGVRAELSKVSVNDAATVTFDAESGEPMKILVTAEKPKAARMEDKKKATIEEPAPKVADAKEPSPEKLDPKEERRRRREAEREAKAIEEVKKQDEEFARQVEETYRVKDRGKGSFGFGPFRTKSGILDVSAKLGREDRIELTIGIVDPPDGLPEFFPPLPPGFGGVPPPGFGGFKPPQFGNKPADAKRMKREAKKAAEEYQAKQAKFTPPEARLRLSADPEFKGAIVGMSGSHSSSTSSGSPPSVGAKGKGNPKPDNPDPVELKKISDQLEKQITGDLEDKPKSSAGMRLRFLVPSSVVVSPQDGIRLDFHKYRYVFDVNNDPKAAEAFRKLIEKFKRE